MNLARFNLLKDDENKIVAESSELVEISEKEAHRASQDVYAIDHDQELLDYSNSLGASLSSGLYDQLYSSKDMRGPSRGRKQSPEPLTPVKRRKRKYVKHEKKTAKSFVNKMKKRYRLFDIDEPVEDMGPKELLKHFPRKDGKEVDKDHFALNVVWSYYRRILDGDIPPFVTEGCNMRTIFYLMKPLFTSKKVFDNIDSFYGNFSGAVKTLVLAGLISYKDFSIMDDRKVYRFMPDADFNTNILLLAEKKSMAGRFAALGSKYGVMSQVTTGRSTLVMTDTMLTEMFEAGYDLSKNLTIFSFCDFDPVGSSIPGHLTKHFNSLGFYNINEFTQYGDKTMRRRVGYRTAKNGEKKPVYKKVKQRRPCIDIVNIHDFDSKTRSKMRHQLKASLRDNPSTAEWAFITGGVTGTGRNKKYAISSEQLLPYVNAQLDEKIRPFLSKPPESVGRQSSYKALRKAIREYIGARAERGG